eukprot:m.99140 g.99140  ORF g.99140 m.99140 type:complete len:389 (-) comp20599_c0_seq4:709-1875(-)
MEGGTSTCSDAGKISRRPVAWIYPSQCDVVGPTRCPLPTNSGSIGGAVGDALTALAMSPGSEVDVASTASASDDPFEAPVTPASLTPVIGLSIGSLTLVETQQPTVSGQVEVTCSPATDGSIATHTYDLASSNEDIAVPCAAASRHRTDSVHVYDDPFEGLSDNEDAEVLAWWVAAQVHLSKTEGTRVTVGGDGGVVEPDRELGESPPDNPIAELDTADWFHGRGNFYSCSSFLSFFSCCVFLLLRPPRLISLEFVSISVPCLRVSAITTCTPFVPRSSSAELFTCSTRGGGASHSARGRPRWGVPPPTVFTRSHEPPRTVVCCTARCGGVEQRRPATHHSCPSCVNPLAQARGLDLCPRDIRVVASAPSPLARAANYASTRRHSDPS